MNRRNFLKLLPAFGAVAAVPAIAAAQLPAAGTIVGELSVASPLALRSLLFSKRIDYIEVSSLYGGSIDVPGLKHIELEAIVDIPRGAALPDLDDLVDRDWVKSLGRPMTPELYEAMEGMKFRVVSVEYEASEHAPLTARLSMMEVR
jgi:hypothetical protein